MSFKTKKGMCFISQPKVLIRERLIRYIRYNLFKHESLLTHDFWENSCPWKNYSLLSRENLGWLFINEASDTVHLSSFTM